MTAETTNTANTAEIKQPPKRIVVVGGVAAGASAATKARRTDEAADVVVFERGSYVSFANCGLPYYVGGDIPRLGDLLLMSPESFARRFRIHVEVGHEVTRIDRAGKQVAVLDHKTGETRWEPYDKLVLAPGARPVRPPIPGIDRPGVFTLTTVPDAEALRQWASQHSVRQAVVVGAGFIGLEIVEALVKLGLEVHLVEKLPQVLPQMDPEMAMPLAAHLARKGVRLHLSAEVVRFRGDGSLSGVALATGEELPAQVAVVAIGVRPELTLAREAGLAIGAAGGIVVDDQMLTSDPSIYACGDTVEVTSRITGRKVRLPLAGPANKEGRIAGANAAGAELRFPGVVGTSVVKVFDLSAGKTGLGEREAREAGSDPIVTFTHPLDHAGYYPGAQRMAFKLVADHQSGRILGAQIVGPSGVDKRIDVVATAIYAGLTVEDLEGLDLGYAPPYSSAKDPAIMAGLVAANEWRGELKVVTPAEVQRRLSSGEHFRLLDVRTPQEYAAGHIPGAQLIPLDDLRQSLDRVRPDGPIVAYCGVGYRSYHACKILAHHGHDVANMTGGFTSWAQAYPENVERGNG
jgi:NADPH-dependent 2,4-dienoyl-CoA reductase/sulfur reductase-like enzyme/rhodanese-related sulfurtransferase